MKTLKFNAKSWHYWLATKIGDFDADDGDFCAYVRSVIFGFFMLGLFGSCAFFLLYALGREVYAAYTCWFTPVCAYGNFERAFTIAVVVLAAIAGIVALCIWNENRKMKIRAEINKGLRQPSEPGFISMAYKSIKEKTCFKVEFK
jgi:hypothetical protein